MTEEDLVREIRYLGMKKLGELRRTIDTIMVQAAGERFALQARNDRRQRHVEAQARWYRVGVTREIYRASGLYKALQAVYRPAFKALRESLRAASFKSPEWSDLKGYREVEEGRTISWPVSFVEPKGRSYKI
jgi:hypothetical protein